MSRYWGIDSYQLAAGQVINAQQLANIDFQIVRIGTRGFGNMGSSAWYNRNFSIDQYCRANIEATQNAGKPCGVYVFSYAWNAQSAIREAEDVCNILDSWGISLRLPIFIDWESTGTPPGTGSYEKFQTYIGRSPTASDVQPIFRSFCERCTARGRISGWYTNVWFTPSLTSPSWISQMQADGYFFWLANWTSAAVPAQTCDIWQYAGDQDWQGITADYNWIMNNAVIDGTPPTPPTPPEPPDPPTPASRVPTWLKLHIARSDKDAECALLL